MLKMRKVLLNMKLLVNMKL